MSRPFEFRESVKREAFRRQAGQCAVCGRSLADIYDHAHHVVPNQRGRARHSEDAWIRESDNCVVLCDACHERVHEDGRYVSGAVAPPEYFAHSHGRRSGEHRRWADAMQRRFWG